MRYVLDLEGYISAVAFGCYLDKCTEYTGTVPVGYNTLDDWATYSCINAYYIDDYGNLALDLERLAERRRKEAQEKIDNAPVLRKDLYGSEAVLDSQYKKETATGEVILLSDANTISPRVKITGIDLYSYTALDIYTQGVNLLPNNTYTAEISGVNFTRNSSGSLSIVGKSTADIEYSISGSATNTKPLFMLKAGHNYYLNLGGFDCELRYFDGETTQQMYVGASGLLNLEHSIAVTEVLLKIPSGKTSDVTFFPQLEYGVEFTEYQEHKRKSINIDIGEAVQHIPSTLLYPSNIYPNYSSEAVDYILIEGGVIVACIGGTEKIIGTGVVGLFNGNDTLYSLQDVEMEVEYSTNTYDVDSLEFLQGKATTTNKFRILEDGSIEAHNGYFSGEITGSSFKAEGKVIKYASDYTEEDLDIVNRKMLGIEKTTVEDLEKYDMNGDGVLKILDMALIRKLLNGGQDTVEIETSLEINPLGTQSIIKTNGVSIGVRGIKAEVLKADDVYGDSFSTYDAELQNYNTGKTGSFTSADGKKITVTNGIITSIF